MKKSKRWLSALLTVILILGLLPTGAFAADTNETGADLTFAEVFPDEVLRTWLRAGGYIDDLNYPAASTDVAVGDLFRDMPDDHILTNDDYLIMESVKALTLDERIIKDEAWPHDISGLEHFSSLEYLTLNCESRSLDLTNISAVRLSIGDITAVTVDFGNNEKAENLNLYFPKAENIDISGCPNITWVHLWDNDGENTSLTALDVSNNIKLEEILAENQALTSLDCSNLPELRVLQVSGNQISDLKLNPNSVWSLIKINDNRLVGFNGESLNKNSLGRPTLIAGAQKSDANIYRYKDHYEVNFNEIVSSQYIDRISKPSAGIYDQNTGVLTLETSADTLTYAFDTKSTLAGQKSLAVTLTLTEIVRSAQTTINDHNDNLVDQPVMDFGKDVIVVDKDGNELDRTTVDKDNTTVTLPEPPAVPGKDFDHWEVTENPDGTVTVSPVYTEKGFKVNFVNWDGSPIDAEQTVTYGAKAVPPAAPTLADHEFLGWSYRYTPDGETDEVAGTVMDAATVMVYGDITFTAKFAAIPYVSAISINGTVNVAKDGAPADAGSETISTVEMSTGDLPATVGIRYAPNNGYTRYDKITIEDLSGHTYEHSLYDTGTRSYETGTGSNASTIQVTVDNRARTVIISNVKDPLKITFPFSRSYALAYSLATDWGDYPELDGLPVDGSVSFAQCDFPESTLEEFYNMPDEEIKNFVPEVSLAENWKAIRVEIYKAGQGDDPLPDTESKLWKWVEYNSDVGFYTAVRDLFKTLNSSWNVQHARILIVAILDANDNGIDDRAENYDITFKVRAGDEALGAISKTTANIKWGEAVSTANVTATPANATFDGWYNEAGDKVDLTTELVKGDAVYEARFTQLPYTVSFDPTPGVINNSADVVELKYVAGGTLSAAEIPADPTSDDYDFMGWYTDPNDESTKLDTANLPVINSDITYYAKWQWKPEKDPSNPHLSGLDITVDNTVVPFVFDPDIYKYDVTLASVNDNMKVKPTAENPDATFKVYLRSNGKPTQEISGPEADGSYIISHEKFIPDDVYYVDVEVFSADGTQSVAYTVAFSIGNVLHIVTDKDGTGAPPTTIAAGGLTEAYPLDKTALGSPIEGVDENGNPKIIQTQTDDFVEVQLRADDIPVLAPAIKEQFDTAKGANQEIADYLEFTLHVVVKDKDLNPKGDALIQPVAGKYITIQAEIPADSRGGSNYQVYRLHDGKVEALETKYDSAKNTVTFETDKFSPYALAYTPKAVTPPSGGGDPAPTYYTLTFVSNGGVKLPTEKYRANTTVELKQTSTWAGHTFLGWYSDVKLTQPVTSIKMTGNKTVYAKWDPASASIPEALNGDDHIAYILGREDGLVHPLDNITRAEVATIVFRLLKEDVRQDNLTTGNGFTDVDSGDWYNTAISTMEELGVVKGRGQGIFDPNASITRAEFAAIMSRFDNTAYTGEDKFPDIADSWARDEINRAAIRGWVQGDETGNFRPDDFITRAEVMTLINRVLARLPETPDALLPDMKAWPDNQDTTAWYYLAVQEATNSHDFTRKDDGFEKWTKLTSNRDWSALEN